MPDSMTFPACKGEFMIRVLAACLALAFATFELAPKAEARLLPPARALFGTRHYFDTIAPLKITPELAAQLDDKLAGEVPYEWTLSNAELAHRSEAFVVVWVVGFWLVDEGVAVHIPGSPTDHDQYWEISEEDLKVFQDLHLVPDPLLDRGIQPMTYLAGWWGWLVVLAAVGVRAYIKSQI